MAAVLKRVRKPVGNKPLGALQGREGVGVDVYGGPAYDPSENVDALVDRVDKRQDDLRGSFKELVDAKLVHLQEIESLRSKYADAINKQREEYQAIVSKAESARLDSIRQVDREEVAKTAVAANTAITTLAKQTTDLATTLQKQVSDTAAAAEARSSAAFSEIGKRLSALELAASEGKGRGAIADPQMEKLTSLVEVLARNQASDTGKAAVRDPGIDALQADVAKISAVLATGAGKSEGISTAVALGIAVATLALGVIGAGVFFGGGNSGKAPVAAPQIIYVPTPAPETAKPSVGVLAPGATNP